jgi:hypothetical protein|tara:strand:- start:702 stop:986 length:285 start_codon:yes stop_codon:yes gene_type:complete
MKIRFINSSIINYSVHDLKPLKEYYCPVEYIEQNQYIIISLLSGEYNKIQDVTDSIEEYNLAPNHRALKIIQVADFCNIDEDIVIKGVYVIEET